MINRILIQRLRPMVEMESRLWRARALAWLLFAGALLAAGLTLAYWRADWWDGAAVYGLGLTVVLAGAVIYSAARSKQPDIPAIARKIETDFPDLRDLLLTAVEQRPQRDGQLNYLQDRVVREAIDHAVANNWIGTVSLPRVKRSETLQGVALVMFTVLLVGLFVAPRLRVAAGGEAVVEEISPAMEFKVTVDPGDTEVEKGSRLVIQARFDADLPAEAELVVGAEGGAQERYPMTKNLEDPVFGGLIPRVPEDTVYHVVYDGRRTEEFEIKTFAFPDLERADATVHPPEHLNLPSETVEDTRSVSAFEGSEITLEFLLNKPVAEAKLTDKNGWEYALEPVADKENTYAVSFVPEESEQYHLNLSDAQQRQNKRPPLFSVKVKKNLPPKIAITAPGRDAAPSAIEEVALEARLWDDLGVRDFGATVTLNGETHEIPLEKRGLDKKGKEIVATLLDLESLKAAPDDSVTYFVWAEDLDPKGEVRRVSSDMFFADVRHFENLFREVESPPGEGGEQQGGSAQKLVEMQREIINATWKLIRRESGAKKEDKEVVHESQGIAIEMVEEAKQEVEDAKLRAVLEEAQGHMKLAAEDLADEALDEALPDEKNAYAALLKARERERRITQSQSSSSSSAQQQERQRQLMELELKQKEKRYESEKMASEEKSEEQRENLQVLNRLKELARREEAIREEIKELQAALAEARTEEEKEELRRQLKRLQEEQEQLLRDVDELRDRMEDEENRARMTAEREQLERTREEVRQASEELKKEDLTKALNSTERASEELEELRDEFQRKTSKQFGEEMREMRREARELADSEEKIRGELQMAESPDRDQPTTEDLAQALENRKLAAALDAQAERATGLMDKMRDVSEQAEESEPLVSEKLYDALRKAQMDQLEESLETASDMASFGAMAQARNEEDKANKAIREMKEGIEKAAQRLLGDESESLRMARAELDRLIDEVQQEGGEQKPGDGGQKSDVRGQRSEDKGQRSEDRGQKSEGRGEEPEEERRMAQSGDRPEGEQRGREPGEEQGQGQGQEEGQQGREAQRGQAGREGDPNQEGQQQARRGEPQGQEGREGQQGEEGKGERGQDGQRGQQRMAQNEQGQQGQPGQQEGQQPGQQGQQQGQQGQQPGQEGQQGQQQGQQGQQAGEDGEGSGGQPQPQGSERSQQRVASGGARGGDGARNFSGGGDMDDRIGGNPVTRLGDREPLFFESEATHQLDPNPITGTDYRDWTDRLRDVEEMLDDTEMRQLAARSLDRAREYRQEYKRNNLPPNQDLVQRHVAGPLLELRDRVAEELARRDKDTKLVPLDRDPVPNRYRELVRGYYEKLGEGR